MSDQELKPLDREAALHVIKHAALAMYRDVLNSDLVERQSQDILKCVEILSAPPAPRPIRLRAEVTTNGFLVTHFGDMGVIEANHMVASPEFSRDVVARINHPIFTGTETGEA